MSPGASPVVPPIPSVERAMTLRTVEEVERITTRVKEAPTSAVVIGGAVIPAAIVIMAIGVRPDTSLANRYRV